MNGREAEAALTFLPCLGSTVEALYLARFWIRDVTESKAMAASSLLSILHLH